MKKNRYTEEQIVSVLRESEAGVCTRELCRKHGILPATFCKWKAKYGGLQVSAVQRTKQLEDENMQLRKLVAQQALDNQALKAVVEKSGELSTATRSCRRDAQHGRIGTTGLCLDRNGQSHISLQTKTQRRQRTKKAAV